MAAFPVSDYASFVNGIEFFVDVGWLTGNRLVEPVAQSANAL